MLKLQHVKIHVKIAALRFLRQRLDVMADIEEMETELQDDEETNKEEETYTMRRLFQTRALLMPLFVAVMLQVIQQLSGINAVSKLTVDECCNIFSIADPISNIIV